jgi:hypothetical protein
VLAAISRPLSFVKLTDHTQLLTFLGQQQQSVCRHGASNRPATQADDGPTLTGCGQLSSMRLITINRVRAVTSSLLSTALAEGHRIRAAIGAAAEALIRYRGG